jgi:hypothetical protein
MESKRNDNEDQRPKQNINRPLFFDNRASTTNKNIKNRRIYSRESKKKRKYSIYLSSSIMTPPPPQQIPAPGPASAPALTIHQMVTKRYKQLRSEGLRIEDAMKQAREELQPSDDFEPDAGTKVAEMFGIQK